MDSGTADRTDKTDGQDGGNKQASKEARMSFGMTSPYSNKDTAGGSRMTVVVVVAVYAAAVSRTDKKRSQQIKNLAQGIFKTPCKLLCWLRSW